MKKLFLLLTVVLMQLLASAATVEIDGLCGFNRDGNRYFNQKDLRSIRR